MANTVGFIGVRPAGRVGSKENTGNFLHGYAARQIVSESVEINFRDLSKNNIEKLRDNLSHVGFVAATTIPVNKEPKFIEKNHTAMAKFIETLGLPVVVFGLGAQAPINIAVRDSRVNAKTKELLHVLSSHAKSIGVRGQYTADLLNALGVKNVDVVGCQSCFLSRDPNFTFPKLPSAMPSNRILVSITRIKAEINIISQAMQGQFGFIGQSSHFEFALKKIKTGVSLNELPTEIIDLLPPEQAHLFSSGKLDFEAYHRWIASRFEQFYDMESWFNFIRGRFDASIGTRFHGNMAAMHSGVPALWIVHDSRTQEFCNYHGLPNAPLREVVEGASIQQILEKNLDSSNFDRVYKPNYRRFLEYLENQGVSHRLAPC